MSLVSIQNGRKGVPAELHAPAEPDTDLQWPDTGLQWPWRLPPLAWQGSLQRLSLLSITHMLLLVAFLHLQSTLLSGQHVLNTCHMQERHTFRGPCPRT